MERLIGVIDKRVKYWFKRLALKKRFGTVTAIGNDGSLEVRIDGAEESTPVIKACSPAVGSRVLMIVDNAQWVAVATVGGDCDPCPFAVGYIYMSATSANPQALWAGTTWVAWGQGRVPVGVGSNGANNYTSADATGGADSVALIHNNVPPLRVWGASTNDFNSNIEVNSAVPNGNYYGFVLGRMGASLPHENRQSYQTCYMWKRTT